jgi:hypothetical protein
LRATKTFTFDASNWMKPATVVVSAPNDHRAWYRRIAEIRNVVGGTDTNYLNYFNTVPDALVPVTVIDSRVGGTYVQPPTVSPVLVAGQSVDYTIRLSGAPVGPVNLNFVSNLALQNPALLTEVPVIQAAAGLRVILHSADSLQPLGPVYNISSLVVSAADALDLRYQNGMSSVTFGSTNWNQPFTARLTINSSSALGNPDQPVKLFPVTGFLANGVQGILAFDTLYSPYDFTLAGAISIPAIPANRSANAASVRGTHEVVNFDRVPDRKRGTNLQASSRSSAILPANPMVVLKE